MSADWRLEELGTIVTGKTPPKAVDGAFSESGVPFLTPKDMDGRKWIAKTERYLSDVGVKSVKKSVIPAGSVAVSCIGSDMGKAVMVPETTVTNQQINTIIPDTTKCEPEYLYYLLTTMQQPLKDIAGGSATPILNKGHFGKVTVELPALHRQKSVARVLGALDDKIQLNHQINQTLEQMAQAIFKSWFVDFEPVKTKIAARERWHALQPGNESASPVCYAGELKGEPITVDLDTYMNLAAMQAISGKDAEQLTQMQAEQPEQYAELCTTADLFPSVMQDSELGEIPDGWEFAALRDQTTVLRGFSYKGKGLADTGIPMHNLNSVLEGGGYKYTGIKYYSLEYKPKFEVQPGDVLVANTEQGHDHLLIGYGTRVPHFFEQGFFSHHLYRIRPNQGSNISEEFLSCLFRHEHFVQQVQGFTNGTTVNMLPMAGVEMPRFVCPTKQLAQAFSALVKPLFIQAEKNYLVSVHKRPVFKVTRSARLIILLPLIDLVPAASPFIVSCNHFDRDRAPFSAQAILG